MRIVVQVFSFLIFLSFATNVHAQEHVSLLKKSVPEWNKWRKRNPGIIPDLCGANLRETVLTDTNLQDTILKNTSLREVYLQGVKNLSCRQLSWVRKLDKETQFPHYLEVKITGGNKRTYKEVKMEIDKQEGELNSKAKQETERAVR